MVQAVGCLTRDGAPARPRKSRSSPLRSGGRPRTTASAAAWWRGRSCPPWRMSASCTGSMVEAPARQHTMPAMAAGGADEAVRPAQPGQCRAALLLAAEGFAKRLVAQPAHPRCNLEPHIRNLHRQERTKNICLPKRSVSDKQARFEPRLGVDLVLGHHRGHRAEPFDDGAYVGPDGRLVSSAGAPIMAWRSKVLRSAPMNSCSLVGAIERCLSSPAPTSDSAKLCSHSGDRSPGG